MSRTCWSDTRGMPMRTRLFTYALSLSEAVATPAYALDPDAIQPRRAISPAPRWPVTLVTGAVNRDVRTSETRMTTRDGHTIDVRVHQPATGATGNVVLYLHGGGFTLGRPIDYESITTQLCAHTNSTVVVPGYRLAPHDKAPTAALDCLDVLDWVLAATQPLGGRVRNIVVAGDSAGGNIAAVLANDAKDRGVRLAGQVLIYPATDMSREHPYRDAPMLRGEALDAYNTHYLRDASIDETDPLVSPLRHPDLTGVAPALVQVAELDPLRDEGIDYARRLRDAGVPTRLTQWHGVPHGYINYPGATVVGRPARDEIFDQINEWFAE